MLVKVFGAAVQGIDANLITIEVNCSNGFKFMLVGLPDASVKESHERIVSALQENGYKFPRKQIIVNMSPADIRKEGTAYDLSLAIGILAASENIKSNLLKDYMIMGELSLDGNILPIKGVLSIAILAQSLGFKGIIVPSQNAKEAAVVGGLEVYGVSHLKEVIQFINEEVKLQPLELDIQHEFDLAQQQFLLDFEEVKGQESVKRALEVAAAGGHNIIMIGPPGAGKSMMAKRIPSILPPFTIEESLETTKIHSIVGKVNDTALMLQRPFRNPHHTISDVALVGGGSYPQPGEISLAHNGVLFLDELPEFSKNALEVLRQPLEDRSISISRSKFTAEYPASFMLVASMNPCPCGFFNHPNKDCVCSQSMVQKYLNKISGPLLDRIDIQIEIVPVPFDDIASTNKSESSKTIRERVINARNIQAKRFANEQGVFCNAQMSSRMLTKYANPGKQGLELLKTAMDRFNLSARAYDRILKVSRTIADLDNSEDILPKHLAEAIGYRNLDRENWTNKII